MAEAAATEAMHLETQVLGEQAPRGSCGEELVSAEQATVEACPLQENTFAIVVSNEDDALALAHGVLSVFLHLHVASQHHLPV